jgi:hypothetical protein
MKYVLPLVLSLSACSTNEIIVRESESCPQIIPIIMQSPFKIKEEKYIGDYFLFSFDIGTKGKVLNLKLLDSNSDIDMKNKAKLAMTQWRFKPFVQDGKPTIQTNCEYKYVQQELDEKTGF